MTMKVDTSSRKMRVSVVLVITMLASVVVVGVAAFTSPSDKMLPTRRTTRIPTLPSAGGGASVKLSPAKSTMDSTMEGPHINNNNNNDHHHRHHHSQQLQQLLEQGKIKQIEQQRQDWIDRSVKYYSKIMSQEKRKNLGQIKDPTSQVYRDEFYLLANRHYFALRKIKSGKFKHAELIYRKIIHDIMNEEGEECDHAKLAVTTLLLALHLQRMGDLKKTRAVFLQFFRIVVIENAGNDEECACSAKVLGAYALFEMKQGLKLKSLEIAKKAIQFDPELEPVLQWKQFRDAVVIQNEH